MENIASKISQQDSLVAPPDDRNTNTDEDTDDLFDDAADSAADQPNDRADHGNVVFVHQQRPANQRLPPQQQNNRRQDANFSPFRFANQGAPPPPPPPANRGQRKLPPPSNVNSVNNNNNGQFRQKPAPQQQQQASSNNNQFGFIPSAFNNFNPFSFFQSSEVETRPQQQLQQQQPLQQQQQQLLAQAPSYPTKRPPVQQLPPQQQQPLQQQQQQPAVGPNNNNNRNNIVNNINDYSAYLESLNAIQTIPAPDLTKIGPPVIELDTKDGQIVVGQNNNQFHHQQDRDHLAGFVSLDFDGFAAGGDLENGPDKAKPKAVDGNANKDKLSLIVGGYPTLFGNTAASDFETDDLVNLLNSKYDEPATSFFLGSSDKASKTPAGFAKLDLPFMDPTDHKGQLPKVFIAPVGKPIPKGYKGKPLPAEVGPTSSSSSPSPTTETVLVVEASSSAVDASNGAEGQSTPSSQQQKGVTANSAFRFKLQKERPSLSQFYLKNKKDKFEELKQQKKQQQPEKLEKFYPKSRVEDALLSKEQLAAVIEEEAAEAEQLSQELIRSEAVYTEAVLPPLTVLSADITTATATQQSYEGSLPTLQQGEAETTATTAAGVEEQPIVQSTLEQQQLPVEEQQLFEQQQEQTLSSTVAPELETSSFVQPTEQAETSTTTTTTSTVATVVSGTTTTPYVAPETTTQSIVYADETVIPTAAPTATTTATPTRRAPKTTQDPFVRLEALRRQKQEQLSTADIQPLPTSEQPLAPYPADLATSEDEVVNSADPQQQQVVDPVAPSEAATKPKTRLRLRKYGGGEPTPSTEVEDVQAAPAAPGKKFGKRIRTRKRPAFWPSRVAGGEEGAGIEPTVRPTGPLVLRQKLIAVSEPTAATALEALKTEDYKKKFRPFFDQLYSQFNKGGEEEAGLEALEIEAANSLTTDGPPALRRLGLPRKRSTTPQPPITVGKHQIQNDVIFFVSLP